MEQVEKSAGFRDPRLDAVAIPEGFERYWELFPILSDEGGISFSEIDAYERVTGDHIAHFEVEILLGMAAERNAFVQKKLSKK